VKTQVVESGDGARIAFDVSGEGPADKRPAVMLLHGAGKSRSDWHKTGYIARLTVDFKVINVDIRGSGESEVLTSIDDYRIEKITKDLEAVMEACKVDETLVWGYSFGGNIARYLGAWSERVKAIAVIGVPFGPAVDDTFDRYIDEFINKYGSFAQQYTEGKLSEKQRKSAIKGRIPVWVACFQAMRSWPRVDPGDLQKPALLVVGTRNMNVCNWINANQDALAGSQIQVEMIEGLNHQQEFSQIDKVYPVVHSFLAAMTSS